MNTITDKQLLKLVNKYFDVDLDAGILTWKISSNNRIKVGQIAGTTSSAGYRHVKLEGFMYRVHRLIFLKAHGYLPDMLDHIDGDKLNNSVSNLRAATSSQNNANNDVQSNNSGGFKGVYWSDNEARWTASVKFNKKCHRKHFPIKALMQELDWEEEVVSAYQKLNAISWAIRKRRELHGEFANHGLDL